MEGQDLKCSFLVVTFSSKESKDSMVEEGFMVGEEVDGEDVEDMVVGVVLVSSKVRKYVEVEKDV